MEIIMRYPNGVSKALTFSYDDGCETDKRLADIFNENGMKGTFNIMSMLFDLPEDHVKERMRIVKEALVGSAHEVACHGYNHPRMDRLNCAEMLRETVEDRRRLEKEFGVIVRGMAYPYGAYNDQVVEAVRACGICYSRICPQSDNFNPYPDWLRWMPTTHHNGDIDGLADKFLGRIVKADDDPLLFYVWGHTFEFDIDKNWSRIENFAKKLGNRDDIWYCTNIEYYDYVQAFNRLQFSVDADMISNPTATDVWISIIDTKSIVKIPAGGTWYNE